MLQFLGRDMLTQKNQIFTDSAATFWSILDDLSWLIITFPLQIHP